MKSTKTEHFRPEATECAKGKFMQKIIVLFTHENEGEAHYSCRDRFRFVRVSYGYMQYWAKNEGRVPPFLCTHKKRAFFVVSPLKCKGL